LNGKNNREIETNEHGCDKRKKNILMIKNCDKKLLGGKLHFLCERREKEIKPM
jgi:hypothetical protein